MVQLSDTHLSAERAYGLANFDAVVEALGASPPDLVVGSGDLALDDVDCESDHRFARRCFDRVPVRWRVLPGNHDLGDTGPDPWMGQPVTPERRSRFVELWGPDWWVEEADAWVVVGLDSLLFASDLPAEGEQWEWLGGVVERAGQRPMMVVLHKPLFLADPDDDELSQMAVTPEGRRRFQEAIGGARLSLVASGHVHQYRSWTVDGLAMVWAPSTAFVSRIGEPSPHGAAKLVGAVEYRFDGRGVAWSLGRPAGMVDHDAHVLAGGAPSLRDGPVLPADGLTRPPARA